MKFLWIILPLILVACSGGSGGGGVIVTDPPVTTMPVPNPIDNSLKITNLSLSNLAAVYQNSQNDLLISVSNSEEVSDIFVFNIASNIFFKPTCEVTSTTLLTCKDIHFYAINFGSEVDNAYRVRIISTQEKDVISVGAIEISSKFADESPTGLVLFPAGQCGSVSGVAGQAGFSCTLGFSVSSLIEVSWKPITQGSSNPMYSAISFDGCATRSSIGQNFDNSGNSIYSYAFSKEDIAGIGNDVGSKTLSLMLYESIDSGGSSSNVLACQEVGVIKVVEDSIVDNLSVPSSVVASDGVFLISLMGQVSLQDSTNLFKYYQIYVRDALTNDTLYYDSNHSFNSFSFGDMDVMVSSEIVSVDTDVIIELNLTTESGSYIILQKPMQLLVE